MLLVAQVNITSRDAATNPGAIDSLSEFAGTYTTVFKSNDDQAPAPLSWPLPPPSLVRSHPLTPVSCVPLTIS